MWNLLFSATALVIVLAAVSLYGFLSLVEKHKDIAALYWMTFVGAVLTLCVAKGWLAAR